MQMTAEKLQICQQWVHIVILIFRDPFVNPIGALISNDNQLVEIASCQLIKTKFKNFFFLYNTVKGNFP